MWQHCRVCKDKDCSFGPDNVSAAALEGLYTAMAVLEAGRQILEMLEAEEEVTLEALMALKEL